MTAGIDRQAQVLLIKAAEDEAVILLPGIPEGPFGFHVQQAVEKLLKALLSQLSIEYKLIHDLDYLADLLEVAGEVLPDRLVDFSKIGTFAVRNRYDEIPEFRVLDHGEAIETVRLIREHVVARIAALSATPQPPPLQ
jgi:HEPN domain